MRGICQVIKTITYRKIGKKTASQTGTPGTQVMETRSRKENFVTKTLIKSYY